MPERSAEEPNVILPATLVGVAVVGVITAAVVGAALSKRKVKPNCSGVKEGGGELDGVTYLEHVTGGASPDEKLPMVISFHSWGATPKGAASFKSLKKVRVIRPEGPLIKGNGFAWSTEAARGNQERLAESLRQTAEVVIPFVRDIQQCRPTVGKPVVTGSSQGGHMAYLIASLAPELVQGAVSVAGWLPEELWNPKMAPTVAIHGTLDATVPYERTAKYAEAMGFPLYSFDSGHTVSPAMGKKWREEVKAMLGGVA